MALVKTMRNHVDQLINDYPEKSNGNKPRYIIMDIDNLFRFRDELRALDLLATKGSRGTETIVYRDLKVLCIFDVQLLIEVVG